MKVKKLSSEIAITAIKDVLIKRRIVITLRELHFLVNRELKKQSLAYSLSLARLKKLVLSLPEIEIKTKRRKDRKKRILKKCPVCKKEITKTFGKNVFGKRIHIGYKCKKCGYYADLLTTMPREYIFVLKK